MMHSTAGLHAQVRCRGFSEIEYSDINPYMPTYFFNTIYPGAKGLLILANGDLLQKITG